MIHHASTYSLMSDYDYAVILKMCLLEQQRGHLAACEKCNSWVWLVDIWSCPKCAWRHLVSTNRSLIFGPPHNIHELIYSMPSGPWYLFLSKLFMLRKSPWVQTAQKVCWNVWFTGLIHKTLSLVLLVQ